MTLLAWVKWGLTWSDASVEKVAQRWQKWMFKVWGNKGIKADKGEKEDKVGLFKVHTHRERESEREKVSGGLKWNQLWKRAERKSGNSCWNRTTLTLDRQPRMWISRAVPVKFSRVMDDQYRRLNYPQQHTHNLFMIPFYRISTNTYVTLCMFVSLTTTAAALVTCSLSNQKILFFFIIIMFLSLSTTSQAFKERTTLPCVLLPE